MFTEKFVNLKAWDIYSGEGNGDQGKRSQHQVAVKNGILTITGTPSGTTGGLALRGHDQQYGLWQVNARCPRATGIYHPVALLWGVSEDENPDGVDDALGEIDFLEFWQDPLRRTNGTTLHYGDGSEMIEQDTLVTGNDWHQYSVLWTPDYIQAWVDTERPYFTSTDSEKFPQNPMQLCLQLDWFPDEIDPHSKRLDFSKTGATMQVNLVTVRTLTEAQALVPKAQSPQ